MPQAERTDEFAMWLDGLRDELARVKVLVRISRLENGNPGDVGPVGGGVSELRIDYGPGYRVYYAVIQGKVTWLLAGGIKKGQQADIERAKRIAQHLRESA